MGKVQELLPQIEQSVLRAELNTVLREFGLSQYKNGMDFGTALYKPSTPNYDRVDYPNYEVVAIAGTAQQLTNKTDFQEWDSSRQGQ